MSVQNLALRDYGNLPNALGPNFDNPAAYDPSVVSFDVVWSAPISRRVSVANGTLGDNYTGDYVENQVTVTWSGTNLATGFSFTANPGTLATSSVDGGFAELGHEQNGSFFSDAPGKAAPAGADAVLTQALTASRAAPTSVGATLVATSQRAARIAAIATGSDKPVQAAPASVQPPAGAGHAPAIDYLFAALGRNPFADSL
jgi:hypothetical protein